MDAICIIDHTEEGNLVDLYAALATVELQTVLHSFGHEVVQILIVLCFTLAEHNNIISDPYCAGATFKDFVYSLLEYIPKGILRYLYRPKVLLKVVRSELSWSSLIDQ